MASAALLPASSETVTTGLAPFRRRASWLEIVRTILSGALILLACLLAAMWLDLMLPLPMQGRWVVTRIGFLAGIIAIVTICWWRARRLTPERLALLVDTQAKTGGETLAGWQLEHQPPRKSSALTQGLAQLASARAGERLAAIAPERVLPADPLRQAAWMLCGGMLVTAVLSAIMPAVAWHQWQRFLFPARDVPPFTGITIELEPSKATVLYGDDLTVKAKVTTGRTEFMELVTVTPDGKEHSLPMLPQQTDQWHAILMRLTTSMDFYARSGRSRSLIGRLKVEMTPQITSTKVRITPPAYTKRAALEGAIPKEGITGLAGTQVVFTVSSNRPLRDGRLRLAFSDGSSQQVTLPPATSSSELEENGATVRGSIQLRKPGRFDISVFDVKGIESHDRVGGTITIAVDQRPVVRILEPKPLSLATPDVRLPVVVAAEDDFGLTSLQLYRSLNGSSATAMPCEIDGGPRRSVEIELPLDRYGVSSGDEIQLFARTEDNDPAGPKGAESPVTIVRIISSEQFQEMMLREEGARSIAAKYQAAERYLENLAEALRDVETAADAAAANPDSQQAAGELQKKIEAAQHAAAEAAKNMEQLSQQPMPIDVDRELAQRLGKMAGEAGQAAEQLGQTAQAQAGKRGLTADEKEQVQKMAKQISGQRRRLDEQAVQPLERLQQAMPLIVDQQRFAELAAQQRDLAQRLDSLRSSSDPDNAATQRRVADLEAQQQQLRESLNNLLDDIAAHTEALSDVAELEKLKATANEFVEAVRDSQALASMAAAQQELLSSNFPDASDEARTAADILESFLSKCNSMGDGACKSCELAFNPSAGCPNLGNSIEQMLAMMGMKPGTSGGRGPGMGFGIGTGGGYSVRSPGPNNVGMYGSLPMSPRRSSQGRGDRQSRGMATNSSVSPWDSGDAQSGSAGKGNAAGQAESGIPPQYRSQVAEYFRQLTEQLGDEP